MNENALDLFTVTPLLPITFNVTGALNGSVKGKLLAVPDNETEIVKL